MDSITILSVNCQGLGKARKRRDVFHYLKQKSCSIYCLQDTHFSTKLETYVKAEWGNNCFFASYSSNSRGVAVMFMNNFEFKINDVKRDRNGNFILVSFSMKDTDILLVNVYGPNRDTPAFYEELTEMVKEYQNHNIIIVGDWNLVLDPQLDSYNYKHINNPKAKESVENMLELGLTDIWREANPDCKRYTWRKTKPLKQSRLDYFLLSDYLVSSFEDTDILPGYRSDHSMVTLKLRFGKEMKRNTFWKFNCSLLKEKKYTDKINDEINNVIEQYAAPHYDKASISGIAKSDLELTVSDKVFLGFLLMKIRLRTISYVTMKKMKEKKRKKWKKWEEKKKKKKKRGKEESLLRDFFLIFFDFLKRKKVKRRRILSILQRKIKN